MEPHEEAHTHPVDVLALVLRHAAPEPLVVPPVGEPDLLTTAGLGFIQFALVFPQIKT